MRGFILLLITAGFLVGFNVDQSPAYARDIVSIIKQDIGQKRPKGCPSRWCACYLDRILSEAGFRKHNTWRARDFASYGKKAAPMTIGSIMVMPHHVGVVAGKCPNGRVRLLSGNHSHRVGEGCYNPGRAIAWRMPVKG